jgi:hypothetical protein
VALTTCSGAVFAVLALAAAAPAAAATTLGAAVQRPTVSYGGPVVIRGVLASDGAGVKGAPVRLMARPAGAAESVAVATRRTDAGGDVSFRRRPKLNTTYRLEYDGAAAKGLDPALSADVPVSVRALVTLRAPGRVAAGEPGSVSGIVRPIRPAGTQVTILVRRGGGWEVLGAAELGADSSYRYTWTQDRPGRLRLRAFVAADERSADGHGRPRLVVVHDPDPHGVPDGLARTIVIDHSEFRLFYYEDGRVVRDFPCVLGAPSTPTPYGRFRIQRKRPHPGGANGACYLGYVGIIGIHGTNQPQLLRRFPRAYSHGCARLFNRDITWLYRRCPIGTRVWNVR